MSQMILILIVETIAITAIGSLLHFTYDWSGRKKWVGFVSAVNESTWEHAKLALSGVFACTLIDVWFLGDNPNYWLAKGVSFVVPVIVIVMIFYGYTSFTRHAVFPVDIMTFVVAAFCSTLSFVWILNEPAVGVVERVVGMVMSCVIIVMYLLLTMFPIRNNLLFEDPITHRYGFRGAVAKKRVKKKSRH